MAFNFLQVLHCELPREPALPMAKLGWITSHPCESKMLQLVVETAHSHNAALPVNRSYLRRHLSFGRYSKSNRTHRYRRRCAQCRRAGATCALPAQAASCYFAAATAYVAPFFALVKTCFTAYIDAVTAISFRAWLQSSKAMQVDGARSC